MATLTINASANGGWYGSVTTTELDTPEACEEACQLLERLLAARTPRARPRKESARATEPTPSNARDTITARLQAGTSDRRALLAGLGRGAGAVLREILGEGLAHVDDSGAYKLGMSPRRTKAPD